MPLRENMKPSEYLDVLRRKKEVEISLRPSEATFHQWADGAAGSDLTRYSAFLGITPGPTINIY